MVPLMLMLLQTAVAGETTHEVEISGSAAFVTRTDWMFSPLPHDGIAPSASLGWSPRGEKDVNLLRLSFTPARIASGPSHDFTWDGEDRETFASAATLVDLQYAYGRRIDGEGWTMHVGGTSANHLENQVNAFALMGIESYFGAFELGPWADLRVQVAERHALEFEAWTPLISWVARNPYSLHSGEHIWNTRDPNPVVTIGRYLGDGQLQTINTYQAIHLRAGYSVALSRTFTAFTRLRADGFHHSDPWPLAEWQLGLDLGLRGTF
jgi:hypothetical protein